MMQSNDVKRGSALIPQVRNLSCKPDRWLLSSLRLIFAAILFSLSPLLNHTPLLAQGPDPIIIDFETNNGVPLNAGDVVTEITVDGITMFVDVNSNGSVNEAWIFDSSSPTGGDEDLGTPNTTCPGGGPGIGPGGEVNTPGENCESLGNILIIQENAGGVPDDEGDGGTITLTFSEPVFVESFDLLDFEAGESTILSATFFDALTGGNQLGPAITPTGLGDNSYEIFEVNQGGVSRIELVLPISGAIADVKLIPESQLGQGSIGDTIWCDDGDDTFEAGEGLVGVTVTLSNAGGTVDTQATGADGAYLFTDLPLGDYTVTVDSASLPDTCNVPSVDPDGGNDNTSDVTISEETPDNLDQDFAYVAPPPVLGSIGDTIWCDDGDDTFEAGEGLVGITVTLSNAGGTVDTQATGADGAYLFTELPLGDYTVTVDSASLPDSCNVPSVDPDGGNDNTSDVTLSEETPDNLDQDFAYVAPPPVLGSIGDTIWCDDGDNTFEAGEGLVGVIVTLSNADGTVDTQATGADGAYLFTELPLGDYTVTVDSASLPDSCNVPSVDPDGGNDNTSDVTLSEETPDNLDQDFAYVAPPPVLGSIGDTIWCDDGDDTFEAGEGLVGVIVTLSNADGTVDTQATGADGAYLFTELPLGDYTVTVNSASLPDSCNVPSVDPDGGNDNTSDVTLSEETPDNLDQDFAYVAPPPVLGSIGDTIWCDDGDNTFEAGEGLVGVTVTLSNAGGTVDTQATGADGSYLFTELPLGDYTVTVDSASLPDSCNVPSVDPDGGNDNTSDVTLSEETPDNLDQDFAYVAPPPVLGSIGDTIWCDDGDDTFEAGEGLVGVTVTLSNADGTVDTQATGADGAYLFTELPLGDYTVTVDSASLPESCNVPSVDPDGGNDNTSDVTLSEEAPDNLDQDFAYVAPPPVLGSIGDTIWCDDGDNTFEAGEGLVGVTVTLSNAGGTVDTQATGADGAYLFTELPLGDYTVTVDSASLPESCNVPSVDPDGGNDNTSDVTLSEEAPDNLDQDFAYVAPPPVLGSIGDTIWCDDGDNTFEAGEGLVGVTVTLSNADGTVDTQATGADGAYLFTELPLGDYTVTVDSASLPDTCNVPSVDPDGGDDNTSDVTLSEEAPDNLDQDFAYVAPTLGSMGDTVWCDDGNGIFDAGEGLVGVSVTLSNADGTVDTQATGADGAYLFTELPLGDYTVTVDLASLPATCNVPSVDPDGGNDSTSNASITEAAPDNLLQDFAYVAPDPTLGSIGDTIWCDDGNGTFEAGEGLTGVSVTLSDATGPITSQVTGADGFYLFQNLALGDYTVTVDLASLPMTCNVPSVDPDGGNDSTSTVTITETAPNNLDQDFAYVAPPLGSIGDTIWCDDGNGTFEAGEGLAGISVTLSNADGTVDTQTTGADGAYLFAELPLGGYTVTVDSTSLPDSCNVPSVDPDGGDDNTSAVTITEAARNNLDQDFAYVAPPPLLGSIGDTIWCDNNGSGAFDAGEGIEGASVTLVGADGTTRTATTDAQGLYLFSELPAGSYTVSIDAVSLPDSCNLPLVDPDGGNDNASTLNLGEDEDNLDQDFGYNPVGCIGDTVWFDQNADGVLDAGENGIGSVNVTLEGADGAVLGSMSTDANGFYQFCDLPAGTYTVNVISGTLPMDLVQTYELDNSLNGSTTAELGPGESRDDVDFGYYEKIDLALTKSVADEEVSIDTTALFSITVVNESDVLATGVTVQDSLPTGLTFSEASASQGTYDSATDIWTIGELSGGQSVFMSILVTVTGEGPYTNTAQVAAAVQEDVDSTPNNNVPGEDDQDDATVRGTATVSVGNYVWLDSDKDGIQDAGETGIAGIGVTLLNGAGTEVGQTTTDENGAYLFTDLPADTYSVRFTLPENYRISPVDAGDNDETDSDVNPDTNSTPGVEVPSGQNLSLDAGIFQLLPNLLLTKTDNSTELQFNNNNAVGSGTIVYSLTYTNAGDLEANNVRIIETVPFSTTFNAALSDDAWDCPDNSVAGTVCTFTVGTLADGQAGAPIIFAVDVIPSELPTGSSQINNTATIDSDSEEPTGRSSSSDSTPVERATPDSLDQEPEPDDGMLRVYIPFMQ